jgi:hypothetical protein
MLVKAMVQVGNKRFMSADPQSPSGVRYVLNSAAFHFIPVERMKEDHYEAYLPLLEKNNER